MFRVESLCSSAGFWAVARSLVDHSHRTFARFNRSDAASTCLPLLGI